MDSSSVEITHDFPPFFKVHKDGNIERYAVFQPAPAGTDPATGVQSKDVVVTPDMGVKARIFLPKSSGTDQKLPLVIHYHGGGFCLGSALDLPFKFFLSSLAAQANVVAITIDYRLAPEHHLPAAHNDSWAGLQWVASHANGQGPESWLNEHVDFGRVFLVGESAGANIAHHVAVKAGDTGLDLNIIGTMIVHPYFGVKEPDRMYEFMCPTSAGFEKDPIINPAVDPNLKKLKSDRVLICVAEKDSLKDRGVNYYETLSKSEWNGKVEFYETNGEDHCFHMFTPDSVNLEAFMKKLVDFIQTN
ncbi:hypothetical protein ACOSP7_005348 [Xanthoceras sorbifolium]